MSSLQYPAEPPGPPYAWYSVASPHTRTSETAFTGWAGGNCTSYTCFRIFSMRSAMIFARPLFRVFFVL